MQRQAAYRNCMMLLALLGTAATGFTAPAFAQADTAPLSDVKFDVTAEYNSNVARSDAARAAARGLSRSDQRITPGLTVDLARNLGQTRVWLNGSAGYDFYRRNSQLNRERIGLEGGIKQPIGPCRVDITAGISRRQSDLGDIAFVNNSPSFAVKNAETRQEYQGDITCGREYGLRPTGDVGYVIARNSNLIRDRAEYDELEYQGGLSYSTPNFGDLTAYAGRRDIDLLNQPTAGGGEVSYHITTIGARYRRDIGSRLDAQFSIGRSAIRGGGALVPNNSGLTWDVEVTAQFGPRLQVTASTGRQFVNSLSSDAAYLRTQPNLVQLTYAVNDRMRLQASYLNERRSYRYATPQVGTFIDRETRQLGGGGFTYDFGRRWQIGLSGGYERRNANGTFFDYDGAFARATLSLSL
ncbi:MAG: hypothetical protein U0S50_17945 [Sphingopyxis sp.]|uniref:hypothetical protein n=1 Tax=Sphingopyxis sp. TaxID=1908224 RepID=UPI002ABA2901|nr:hypothetical protein [Sphingopyxis sp.]MDZ3833674.1 hypothetical protein [Sphingopyxis sp.]